MSKKKEKLVFVYNPLSCHNATKKLVSVPNWDKVNELSDLDGVISLNNELQSTKRQIMKIKEGCVKDLIFMNKAIPKEWVNQLSYKTDMMNIIYKNDKLHDYLRTVMLQSDNNDGILTNYNSTGSAFTSTQQNVNNVLKRPKGSSVKEHNAGEKEEFYITGFGDAFGLMDNLEKEKDDKTLTMTKSKGMSPTRTIKKTTRDSYNEERDIGLKTESNLNHPTIERPPRSTVKHEALDPNRLIRKEKTRSTMKLGYLSDLVIHKTSNSTVKKSPYGSNLIQTTEQSTLPTNNFTLNGNLKTLENKTLLNGRNNGTQLNTSQLILNTAPNALPNVSKSYSKHLNDKETLSSFLGVSSVVYKEIKNEVVKKMLEDVNGSGPRYQFCHSCNNHNIDFYNALETENSIKVLNHIRKKKYNLEPLSFK